ncbi:hypothetical protein IFVP408_C290301 [Vibrio parahaemolyticus]
MGLEDYCCCFISGLSNNIIWLLVWNLLLIKLPLSITAPFPILVLVFALLSGYIGRNFVYWAKFRIRFDCETSKSDWMPKNA